MDSKVDSEHSRHPLAAAHGFLRALASLFLPWGVFGAILGLFLGFSVKM
jgi:hypothetical protein